MFRLKRAALVAEVIGAAAVVISLVFVGVQVAQSNALAREAAEQKQIESINVISRLIIENPQLADAMARTQIGEELTPAEQVLMNSLGTFTERTWEALYLQYKAGRVAPELWEAHHSQAMETYGTPGIQDLWERRKHWFSKSYREYRDAEAAKAGDAFRLPYDGLIKPPASQPESDAQQPAPPAPKPKPKPKQ
ncbi:MAG TPA: hypothetical protein VGO52_04655 [Hyphomonadaceae bacterium]|jgi:hypothetical protein|nr:hypothetical protein [Hyphomonadaceae bacterium]